jgi:Tfp pilus assembly protein PilW
VSASGVICRLLRTGKCARRSGGFTLAEMLVGFGVGMLVLLFMVGTFVVGLQNMAGLGNYGQLSNQSRLALDLMSRDVRQCTQVLSYSSNSVETLTFTNAFTATQVTYTYNPTNSLLTCDKTGQPTQIYLTGCEGWTVQFYQRTPQTNWVFFTTTNLANCKLINMTWKCSRSILGKKMNTEHVVTAELVLRNKP